jgi:hypothetical protein
MNTTLLVRLGLCLISGVLVGMAQQEVAFFDNIGEPAIYIVSGIFFAAAVLVPYVKPDKHFLWRAPALAALSTLSYYTAVRIALDAPFLSEDLASFTIASIIGAAIVLVPFKWLTGVSVTKNLFVVGAIAGIVGGPLTLYTLPTDNTLLVFIGHTIWHAMIATSLWFGTVKSGSSDSEEFFGGRLFSSI